MLPEGLSVVLDREEFKLRPGVIEEVPDQPFKKFPRSSAKASACSLIQGIAA